ncbi:MULTISPECIES: hypothetical protein [unclassified Bradyrhizobium]|uniref:hypothetical protein n=1 Tax=unclassified Bradyrhizobium TaxID=2631580 RepID=UPI001FFAD04C|nr:MULTISPECIES: hypothetical protein [unclassified Bradyrhizobium]MCK1424599.1 hypothetical protein [Bradyrhizobium sp. CW12]MCK1646462.1 hypothetical protein [Bradyrhizobium sp. 154]MCK1758757.1 hypothetical protein [Bradyrhizobium sp. 137]
MSEETYTKSKLQAAVAAAVADERRRLAAIMGAPEAAGREGLALTLATTTSQSVDQARAALAAATAVPASGRAGASPLGLSIAQPTAEASGADASSLWDKSLASRGMKVGGGK